MLYPGNFKTILQVALVEKMAKYEKIKLCPGKISHSIDFLFRTCSKRSKGDFTFFTTIQKIRRFCVTKEKARLAFSSQSDFEEILDFTKILLKTTVSDETLKTILTHYGLVPEFFPPSKWFFSFSFCVFPIF